MRREPQLKKWTVQTKCSGCLSGKRGEGFKGRKKTREVKVNPPKWVPVGLLRSILHRSGKPLPGSLSPIERKSAADAVPLRGD